MRRSGTQCREEEESGDSKVDFPEFSKKRTDGKRRENLMSSMGINEFLRVCDVF